jgi:hypothetical protein
MKTPWVMPEWMEQYRHLILNYGNSIENAMSGEGTFPVDSVIVVQVTLLTTLHNRRLLKSMPKLARAKKNDPQTSHDAAKGVNLTRGQREAIRVIDHLYNFIDDEMIVSKNELKSPLSDSGIKTRRHELVNLGYVADTGLKRLTKFGNKATVWNITASGKALAQAVRSSDALAGELKAAQ